MIRAHWVPVVGGVFPVQKFLLSISPIKKKVSRVQERVMGVIAMEARGGTPRRREGRGEN